MSDIRDVLAEIEQRVDLQEIEGPRWEAAYRADGRNMLAALRAVLDDCDVADRLTQGEGAALVSTTRIRQGIAIALSGAS